MIKQLPSLAVTCRRLDPASKVLSSVPSNTRRTGRELRSRTAHPAVDKARFRCRGDPQSRAAVPACFSRTAWAQACSRPYSLLGRGVMVSALGRGISERGWGRVIRSVPGAGGVRVLSSASGPGR